MNTHDGLLVGSLIVSDKPTCTACRRLFTLLTERRIDFERVHYIVDPLSPSGT